MAGKGFWSFLLQGAADSAVNLAAQSGTEAPKGKKGSIAGGCRPCAAQAKRNAMHDKWRGNGK